jgi:hypothetical protein
MKSAAIGFRPHSGWTALVVLSLEKGEPVVLIRDRIHLVKIFNYAYRQPYHTAAKASLAEGRAFISRVKSGARRLAYRALQGIQKKLEETDYRLTHYALLLASSRALPELEKILAAHPLIHTADGELFREALSFASQKYGLKELHVKERELLERAAENLRCSEDALLRRVTELGRPLGSPWSQDEKFATLVAWLALRDARIDRPARPKAKLA